MLLLWLLALWLAAGCVAGSGGDEDASLEPVLPSQLDAGIGSPSDQGCEVATACAADEYCVDGRCEARPSQYDAEPGYPGLQTHDGVCRVVMSDDLNGTETTLQVERINTILFVVTSGVGTDNPWSVEVVLYGNGEMDVDAGVPDLDYAELCEQYALQDTGQLRFDQPSGYPCSEFEQGLAFFLVMEWFFFG